ncbi:NAD(P)H-dependent oxidoreductase subunit E [Elusimicrobiota bacterium]
MIAQKTKKILEKETRGRRALIPLLQNIQNEYNYLPEEAMKILSESLSVPLSELYSVATFYKTFSFKPKGKKIVTICVGTACHVRGAERTLDAAEKALGVKAGETSADGEHTLETVNCLGACALGPIVVTGKTYHGQMTSKKTEELLKD